jgi:Putative zinc dependent peptidase (DUF5700)
MRKIIFFLLIFMPLIVFGQLNWNTIKNNDKLPQTEAAWLHDSLSKEAFDEVVGIVSKLSRPAAAQMLVTHFYLDGSYKRMSMKPYIDSFNVRPPDGDAGTIRVAYLAVKLHKKLAKIRKETNGYADVFTGATFKIPPTPNKTVNKNIELGFDYTPANVVMDILTTPDISYNEILKKIDLKQFKALYEHHNQSFYDIPLNRERMAKCLEKAASTQPIDALYRYINPDGLLYFTDVKNNLTQYRQQIATLAKNETAIFDHIKAKISSFLPENATFSRKVSFFFINGSDGWGNDDVTAIDINYYKDDYDRLIDVLSHETYHSGQNAVAIKNSTKRSENVQTFVDIVDYLFIEGTASYVTPPDRRPQSACDSAVKKGVVLLDDVYKNTIVKFDAKKAQDLSDAGIQGGGPFYWLGAEMTRTIVDVFGKEKLASIIPNQGITFFKTYIEAVKKSKKHQNLLGADLEKYINSMK